MNSRNLQAAIGLVLLAAGLSGPISYADDWRHSGEIAAAIGFALSGALLSLACLLNRSRWIVSSRWVASAVLLGLALGSATDMAALGVTIGSVVGFAMGWRHRLPPNNSFKPTPLRGAAQFRR